MLVGEQIAAIQMALFCELRVNLKGGFVVLKMYIRKKYAGLFAAVFRSVMVVALAAGLNLTR